MKNNSIKIAIADDHTILRKGVIELINSFGPFEVIIDAVNGRDLLDQLEKSIVQPDICVIDINMPELNGYETALILRAQWPKIKILALSMYSNEYSIIKMLRNGAHGYILKETDPTELKDALLSVYHHSFYHSDLVSGRMMSKVKDEAGSDLGISDRELEFLSLCSTDLTYKEIAEKMNLSPRTVEGYRDSLFHKLNIKSRPGLVVFANKIGLNQ
jgi:DNA-binding NarL/FixJ family response regulator